LPRRLHRQALCHVLTKGGSVDRLALRSVAVPETDATRFRVTGAELLERLESERSFHVKADGSGCECAVCLALRRRPVCQSCHEGWPCMTKQLIDAMDRAA
jgi:hypothetical protein